MRIDVWSDLICPWCYIGKRRLERALADFPDRDKVEVVHHSFRLDPNAPPTPTPVPQMLADRYRQTPAQVAAMLARTEQTAAADGLEYHLARTLSGDTTAAHRLVQLAKDSGRADPVIERFYRAHFSEGRWLYDATSLLDLATEAGLDRTDAAAVLSGNRYADAVEADEAQAHAIGVRGVPFFVLAGRYGLSGAQAASTFSAALTQAWAETAPAETEGASCAADGCEAPGRR